MAAASAPSVRGPVATRVGRLSSSSVTSLRTTVMPGWLSTSCVTQALKASRSTARAPPAATRTLRATGRMWLPSRSISALSRPEAESGRSAFKLLEQTSSAKFSLLWAGLLRAGFCSKSST